MKAEFSFPYVTRSTRHHLDDSYMSDSWGPAVLLSVLRECTVCRSPSLRYTAYQAQPAQIIKCLVMQLFQPGVLQGAVNINALAGVELQQSI